MCVDFAYVCGRGMLACVCIQVCAHLHVHTCGGMRLMSNVLLDHLPFHLLRQGLSPDPKLAKVTSLTRYLALEIWFLTPED